ncbi:unnamed protein product [Linum trigynum]|uniref:Uncharacterized protein n=1 Tax=Linum trigynum TaxID=586398 RepID=A0AAV2E858_9ROSI
MAGYGNTYKGGYTTSSTPRANEWKEPSSYSSDHVHRPVIIDAEGRKRPIEGGYTTYSSPKADEWREPSSYSSDHVHRPVVIDAEGRKRPTGGGYTTYSSPRADEWREPSSYPADHVHKPVTIDAEGRKRPIVSLPNQTAEAYRAETMYQQQQHAHPSENRHGQSMEPANAEHYRVEQKLHETSDSVYDRLQKVEEIITKVHHEVSSTQKFGPFNGGKSSQPDSSLSGATNNIGTAIGYLKEAIKPAYTEYNYSKMEATHENGWPKRGATSAWSADPTEAYNPYTTRTNEPGYVKTMDTHEAARRYGNFKFSPRPYATGR